MATVDLHTLNTNEMVLHFAGRSNEIDAFTFSNSLIAFSEAAQEINRQINPDHSISVIIDGVGPGSFRTRIKTTTKTIKGLFKHAAGNLILNILASYIFQAANPPAKDTILITEDSYTIESSGDTIVLPKAVYLAREQLPHPERIKSRVADGFTVLERDNHITGFGITKCLNDEQPLILIPRSQFEQARTVTDDRLAPATEHTRYLDQPAHLIIIRAILEKGTRRWQFAWNGIRISAPITDPIFYEKLASKEYLFAQGGHA